MLRRSDRIGFLWNRVMRDVFKSSFFRRFLGGFVLGAIGVVALHPGAVAHNLRHAPVEQTVAG